MRRDHFISIENLYGSQHNDSLSGDANDNVVAGLNGDDVLHGLGGNDRLVGGAGADDMFGGDGDDVLVGGLGNDEVFGGAGADRLIGSAGDDRLDGGAGNDLLVGGTGADTYVYTGASGADKIIGFEQGLDTIEFENLAGEFASLTITQQGVHTLISSAYGTILVIGANALDFDAADFSFTAPPPAEPADEKHTVAEDLGDTVNGQDQIADFLKAVPVQAESFEYVDSDGMLAMSADADGLWDMG